MRPFWFLAGFVPLVTAQNASKGNEDQSLLWGTYRPNLYFGLRPRLPQSLMSGLMWWGTQEYASLGSQYNQTYVLHFNNAYIRVSSV
jgi:mannosyl-oligosaccharide glucosidase